jgi:trimeric autotransporter adhesin
MRTSIGTSSIGAGALVFIGMCAHATQPPDVVVSDANGNTAMGTDALQYLTTGTENTAGGFGAATANSTGSSNTAFGSNALFGNVSGTGNTGTGFFANSQNNGSYNTANGYQALGSGPKSAVSNDNTGIGAYALQVASGDNNTALGYQAGLSLTTGSNNIDIGNEGVAAESGTIRIGTAGTQTATHIAGIESSVITGAAVYVNANGRLGVLSSSERYKTAVAPIGAGAEKLQLLRPVSFHLKADPDGAVQYGLIAEEVYKIYPELVIHDSAGKIQGVHYEELAPLLLSEAQRQAAEIRDLERRLELKQKQLDSQTARLDGMEQRMSQLLVAQR